MLRPAHLLMACVTALLALAVVMVWSAGMSLTHSAMGTVWRQAIYALLALGAMLLGSRLDVREIFRPRGMSNPLFLVLGVSLGLAVLTLVIGRSVNGASRWLTIGPVTFQPSELVKWTMVLTLAWWCARRSAVLHRFWDGLLPPLLVLVIACGLVGVEDLGSGVLIAAVGACVLIAGGVRWWQVGLFVPPAAVAVVVMILIEPFRMKRIFAFLDPWKDSAGAGYHPIQSMVAIAQGGIFGRGLGNGIQKFGYLPEDTTDFIFAVICEELGLAGAAVVVGGYLVILWVGLGIVRECRDTFGRLLGLGVLLMVGMQAAMNLAVVTAMVPSKGIALPLISSGGTGWVMTAFALGLVASLDHANVLEAELD